MTDDVLSDEEDDRVFRALADAIRRDIVLARAGGEASYARLESLLAGRSADRSRPA